MIPRSPGMILPQFLANLKEAEGIWEEGERHSSQSAGPGRRLMVEVDSHSRGRSGQTQAYLSY